MSATFVFGFEGINYTHGNSVKQKSMAGFQFQWTYLKKDSKNKRTIKGK